MQDITLDEVLYFWIDKANKQVRQKSQQVFREKGIDITVDQWLVLKKVSDNAGNANQSELASLVAKDTASVTRILDHLVKKELVLREPSPTDRRSFVIRMTSQGHARYQEILPVVRDLRAKGLHGINEQQIEVTRQVLQKVIGNME